LLATDGSDDAKTAVAWLRHLPLPPDREVLVVTVITPPLLPAVPDLVSEMRAALVAEARRLVDDTAAEVLTGRTATGRVVEGDPRDEIVAAAASWGADLIVLGARGLGAISGFLLGSVSLAVARHAPCPVLVCKGAPREVRSITVALDGSTHARRALAWLRALPLPETLRVALLAVATPERYPSTAPGILRGSLRTAVAAVEGERRRVLEMAVTGAADTLRGRVAVAEPIVATGAPADVIVRHVERSGSDLVVVGARGVGAVKRVMLGSVSEMVLRHAPCPVLVVRARAMGTR
jgi:nucleotide-binding universal stress UspA family protein